ncbi:adenosylhomocysteinase [Christensenella tenuis]|jgi:adenosylhomocysteinase|uniref:Adenosylhomocysteinase n=1 Tax=Christensenella tenuis TaxID=2763033 RepID=A0ABR7EB23_9FIRM|nr:adenosylhomocysteinase [Christensenella tenuis]MBC5646975.1 adenosylhomocysteinase [Christensenella tenuis]
MSDIKDIKLAPSGKQKIEWVKRYMPVLKSFEEEFAAQKPFDGYKMCVCCHLEAKTAYLIQVIQACGAQVAACASNPLSTQDDVVAALVEGGADVYAIHGETMKQYDSHIRSALGTKPNLIVDDGGDVITMLHEEFPELLADVIGASEETTTGVLRLKAMEKAGELKIPVIPVNDAQCKYMFDNRYGTGQSVWDGIMRTTNLIVAGKRVVVAGYGWCGKGVAKRAAALGARVIVTEIDHIKATEALMDGFDVMSMNDAAALGDIFVTVTGCEDVIVGRHFDRMKDGVLLANAGHFDCEVKVSELAEMSEKVVEMRNNVDGYVQKDGRILNVIAGGRLVNLASGDGHPAEIMDMSFALQFLAQKYLKENYDSLHPGLLNLPKDIDYSVAVRKLKAMGGTVDVLTPEQHKYLYGD